MTNYGPRKLRWQCTKLKEFNLYFCQSVIFMHILVRFIDLYTYDSHTMVRFGLRLFMRLRFWFFFYQKNVNTAASGYCALCTVPTPLSTSTHWPCYGTVSGSHVLFTRPTNLTFQQLFSLKMGHTVLFIHLKIILLQCFQFSAFSCIQTDP